MTEQPRVSTWLVDEQWERDEETGGDVAMLVEQDGVLAGVWRPGDRRDLEVDLDHTEIVLVLTGSGRLQIDDQPAVDLVPGRAVRIEAGAHATWDVSADFSEVWIYV
jgi:uncharacterized cupin superfamily protein